MRDRKSATQCNHAHQIDQRRRTVLRGAGVAGIVSVTPILWMCSEQNQEAAPAGEKVGVERVPPHHVQESAGSETDQQAQTGTQQAAADSSEERVKMSKQQAQYQNQPNGEEQCARCIHFIADSNQCKMVEGQISPGGWCRLWVSEAQQG